MKDEPLALNLNCTCPFSGLSEPHLRILLNCKGFLSNLIWWIWSVFEQVWGGMWPCSLWAYISSISHTGALCVWLLICKIISHMLYWYVEVRVKWTWCQVLLRCAEMCVNNRRIFGPGGTFLIILLKMVRIIWGGICRARGQIRRASDFRVCISFCFSVVLLPAQEWTWMSTSNCHFRKPT